MFIIYFTKLTNVAHFYSLIIKELSKWKTFLCNRVGSLESSLQSVLDENRKNRHLLKSAHEYVRFDFLK